MHSLQDLNTLRLDVKAESYQKISSLQDLDNLELSPDLPYHILSRGSNTLFTRDYPGLILHNSLRGKKILKRSEKFIVIEVGAGEDWNAFVDWAVAQGFGGVENLALIPGLVGAAPVQNIAAYGQNVSDVITLVTCYDLINKKLIVFPNEDCQFAYRTSLFKLPQFQHLFITSVTFKLSLNPQVNTEYFSIGRRYESITAELASLGKKPPYTIKDTYQAVTRIRTRKLPDVSQVPSVGSFFKNPLISQQQLKKLLTLIPHLQYYPPDQLHYLSLDHQRLQNSELVKIPVGRLIDERGWPGRQVGNCFIYPKWASILTHNGRATGEEFHNFARQIAADIKKAYDIDLESEVTII